MTRRGGKRGPLVAGLALIALCAIAPIARADDSQIRISEVYSDGSIAHGDFVELQMLADGQQIPQDSAIRVCSPTGAVCVNYLFPENSLPAAVSQRTVLFGWDDNPATDFGIPSNTSPPNLNNLPARVGGSACYMHSVAPAPNIPVDCVAWGTYTAGAPSVGAPAPAMDGTLSLTRSEGRGCPTLMEAADDSDNSAADFNLAPPSPRNNLQTPSEVSCPVPAPATTKKKCKKKKKHHAAQAAKKKKCKKKKRK
jgi:hypothetical protein